MVMMKTLKSWEALLALTVSSFVISADAQSYSETVLTSFTGTPTGPNGVAVATNNNIYATVGNAVELISADGTQTLLAGSLASSGDTNGLGAEATFNDPMGITTDLAGNVYVADSGNNLIRKITASGSVTTLAGSTFGNIDGTGDAAQFNNPTSIAADSTGDVYVVDSGNNELREISSNGTTTTLLSGGALGLQAASGVVGISTLLGVALDSGGNPYVSVMTTGGSLPNNYHISGSILKVSGSSVSTVATLTGGIDGPFVVSGNGEMYVLIGSGLFPLNDGAIGNSPIAQITGSSSYPTAIALNAIGQFFLANPSSQSVIQIAPVGDLPTIDTQPVGGTLAYGSTITLSVGVSGALDSNYHWQLNGVSIPGANSSSYTASSPGIYTVLVTNAVGTIASNPAIVSPVAELANISSRCFVGLNANVEIVGFVVTGPRGTSEQVLIRGVGPTLAEFGVSGPLAQPALSVFDSTGKRIANNSGWSTSPDAANIAAATTSVGAFTLPGGSADSALLLNLAPGLYTAEVTGTNGSTGVALAEVYVLGKSTSQLVNVSSRSFVGTGTNAAIAGIVVQGSQPAKFLIRAVGPTLSQFGVSGSLLQPQLSVFDSSGNVIATNEGWSNNAGNADLIAKAASATGAFALPAGSADSALLIALPPGAYTAVVSGSDGSTGVALVEAYEAP